MSVRSRAGAILVLLAAAVVSSACAPITVTVPLPSSTPSAQDVEGWDRVRTDFEVTGPVLRQGDHGVVVAAKTGRMPCLLLVQPDAWPTCVTRWTEPADLVAIAGTGEWLLAAAGPGSGHDPAVWSTINLLWDHFQWATDDPPLPFAAGAGPTLTPLTVAVDQAQQWPLVAGTIDQGGRARLVARLLGDDTLTEVDDPGGPGCCFVAPGHVVRAAATERYVLLAATVSADGGGEPVPRVWLGGSAVGSPFSWTEVALPPSVTSVLDARGDTLDSWIAGEADGRLVVARTHEPSEDIVLTPVPDLVLDPDHPVAVLAEVPSDDEGVLTLAVQTDEGPRLVTHRPDGWQRHRLPPGTVVDADVYDGLAYVTLQDANGRVGLWSKRIAPVPVAEEVEGSELAPLD